ncbi:hypothetical protein EJB05_47637 [Eragrostis curvula]|uniref:dihydroxy-acid dehydratase n=14 Tax=Poaceae TaxID=4479 RepID=A0A5J9SZM4_9POAL|nr:hypothetical protein EJB05_47637 [Eragrostis curvula]
MQSLALTSPSLPAAGPTAATGHGRRFHRVRATAVNDEPKLNKYSARITEPKSQGASQAVLYGVGLTDADLRKPQVGISSVWYEGNTCNMHLLHLAEAVREGVREAGMVGFRFNTVGVSDAISMGTRGMCYSLQSRDLIADSIETVMGAQHYDANISIPGCDKNMPGTIMAMGRLNRPSIMIYGGTIKCYGEYVSGSITEEQRKNVVRNSCPGAGACGGMYTANTMASAIETMGMSLPYSSSTPAEDPLKIEECRLAGKYLLELLKMDLKPRDIITEKSLHNAMVIVMALGGSTNAVLHLIAIARSVGLHLTLDDFQKVSDQVPFLADLKPSGKYVMEDLHKIGGTPAVIHYLLEQGLLDGDCMTVTGKTLAENAKIFPPLSEGQQIIRPLDNPIKSTGHIQILYGNLAPEGSVAKITGKEGLFFSGPALVFEGEESMITAISENPSSFKGKVVVIRGEGPKGGPGMPEMLTPTSAIMGAGLGKECALLTDGRFSGGSHGFVVGHICPEAQEGGPIGLVQNGDKITIDVGKRVIDVDLTEEQLDERRRKWSSPAYKANRGALWKPTAYTTTPPPLSPGQSPRRSSSPQLLDRLAALPPPPPPPFRSLPRCRPYRLPARRTCSLHLTGLLAMATEPPPPATEKKKKAPLPKVVTLNKALKLAQTWVDKMSPTDPDEPNDKDFEGRPSRLGLGAKVATGVKRAAPTDPVERRLLGKVNAQKRRSMEEENKTAKEANEASDDDSGEPESRTSAFNKKRTLPSVTSKPSGKKAK